MRCSGCGNELPDWANGVCYVCGRIRREEKRFGAHPSARKQARSTPTPASGPVPRSDGSGSNITLPPWLVSAKSDHCPVCGQEVPQDRLEEHIELHRRLIVASASHGSTSKASARLPGQPAQSQVPKAVLAGEGGTGQTPLQIRRRAINQLLADIYGRKYFLSDILRHGGISQADITKIYEGHLTRFLDELLTLWQIAFAGELAAGAWHLITRNYGLDGASPLPVERLAQEIAISPQQVREGSAQTLRILRTPASREHLESMTLTVAHQQLERT
jgi:hypothetical protein